jgi:GAF domain-containing protein
MSNRKEDQLAILYEISAIPTRYKSVKEILDIAIDKAGRLLGSDVVLIYLKDPVVAQLRAGAAWGVPLEKVRQALQVMFGETDLSREKLLLDPSQPSPFPQDPLRGQFSILVAVGLPLRNGDELLGWLYAGRKSPQPFQEEEMKHFSLLAERIAAALANIRHTEEDRRQAARLRLVQEVVRLDLAPKDIDELLARATDLIWKNLETYHTSIFLVDKSNTWAVMLAASGEASRELVIRSFKLRIGQEGLIGYVTHFGESRTVPDVLQEPLYIPHPLLPATRSEVVLPIKSHSRILGALDVQSLHKSGISQEDIESLQTVAGHLAAALENAVLENERQNALKELEVNIARSQRAFVEANRVDWSRFLRTQLEHGFTCDSNDLIKPVEGPLPDEILEAGRTGSIVLLEDGILAVPIKIRDYIAGVLRFRKPPTEGGWTEDEIQLMETLTDQLGMALESARLYDSTQRRAARERLLSDITAKVRASTDMEVIMKTAVQELAEALMVPKGSILLKTEGGGAENE